MDKIEIHKRYRDRQRSKATSQELLVKEVATLKQEVATLDQQLEALEEQLERYCHMTRWSDDELNDARKYIENR